MKILHIGYALKKASGVTTFVENVAAQQRLAGHEADVVDAAKVRGTDAERKVLEGIADYDIVHLHCLWQLHPYAKAARTAGVPIVWSTHGMLAPWAVRHKWLKKKMAWLLFQRQDLKRAAAIHCTTEQEVEWNRRFGLCKCFVAPLGTREREFESSKVREFESSRVNFQTFKPSNLQTFKPSNLQTLLFVGRIHPVKGLENLIRAWKLAVSGRNRRLSVARDSSEPSRAQASAEQLAVSGGRLAVSGSGWKLRIVGPDEGGYLTFLMSLVSRLGLDGSVEFAGPKYGDDLSREYENCSCLVLPSFTENFGATVVDAMAHGKPVITSTFTPWQEVKEQGCGWWVSNEPERLAAAIREMMSLSDAERGEMGERGRRIVSERYVWPAVAETVMAKYIVVSA